MDSGGLWRSAGSRVGQSRGQPGSMGSVGSEGSPSMPTASGHCFNCHEKGHFAKDCPHLKREKSEEKEVSLL